MRHAAGACVYTSWSGRTSSNVLIRTMSAFTQNAMGDEDSIAAGCIFITGILETWTEFGVIICATGQETHAGPIVSAGELEFQHTEYIERINNEGLLEYEEEAVASINNK